MSLCLPSRSTCLHCSTLSPLPSPVLARCCSKTASSPPESSRVKRLTRGLTQHVLHIARELKDNKVTLQTTCSRDWDAARHLHRPRSRMALAYARSTHVVTDGYDSCPQERSQNVA